MSKKHWGYPEEWIRQWKDELTLTQKDLAEMNVIVLDIESKLVGFCALLESESDYEIIHLWLLPDFIGKGLGKKLLEYVLNKIAVKKIPVIVEADPNAASFYGKQGFQTFDRKESFPDGRFLPIMRRDPL